jgi:hypothetical protein
MINEYEAYYSTTVAGTYTKIPNLVEFTINVGRRNQLDQYGSATASLVFRYPTGYASPITALVTGNYIRITGTEGAPVNFSGTISNVRVKYGIPYSGGVGNADFLYVECESWFASVGRMQGNGYAMASDTVLNQMLDMSSETGLSSTSTSNQVLAATTVSTTWGDWINRTAMTINGRLVDAAQNQQLRLVSPFKLSQSFVTFTDAETGDGFQKYNQIEFLSLADNFYTQITVDPESYSAVTVTKSGATVPYRNYKTNTFNSSTSQATDLANYLLGNYGTSTFAIASISASQRSQGSYFLLDAVGQVAGSAGIFACVGFQVNVVFRGTTFACVVEGCTVSGNVNDTNYTFHLSGADLNAYLLLDNAVFGKLDNNKLGY